MRSTHVVGGGYAGMKQNRQKNKKIQNNETAKPIQELSVYIGIASGALTINEIYQNKNNKSVRRTNK